MLQIGWKRPLICAHVHALACADGAAAIRAVLKSLTSKGLHAVGVLWALGRIFGTQSRTSGEGGLLEQTLAALRTVAAAAGVNRTASAAAESTVQRTLFLLAVCLACEQPVLHQPAGADEHAEVDAKLLAGVVHAEDPPHAAPSSSTQQSTPPAKRPRSAQPLAAAGCGELDSGLFAQFCSLAVLGHSRCAVSVARRVVSGLSDRKGDGMPMSAQDAVLGAVWRTLLLDHVTLHPPGVWGGKLSKTCLGALADSEDPLDPELARLLFPHALASLCQYVRARVSGEEEAAAAAAGAEKLAGVVVVWIQAIESPLATLAMAAPADPACDDDKAPPPSSLAQLVYVCVLWPVACAASEAGGQSARFGQADLETSEGDLPGPPASSGAQGACAAECVEGDAVGDHLQACLLSVILDSTSLELPHRQLLRVHQVAPICVHLARDEGGNARENDKGASQAPSEAAVDRLAQVLLVARDHGLLEHQSQPLAGQMPSEWQSLVRRLVPRPLVSVLLS